MAAPIPPPQQKKGSANDVTIGVDLCIKEINVTIEVNWNCNIKAPYWHTVFLVNFGHVLEFVEHTSIDLKKKEAKYK